MKVDAVSLIEGAGGLEKIYMRNSNLPVVLICTALTVAAGIFIFRIIVNKKKSRPKRMALDILALISLTVLFVFGALPFIKTKTGRDDMKKALQGVENVKAFYSSMKQLGNDYYNQSKETDFLEVTDELKNQFDEIFADEGTYKNILENIIPPGLSQQPDRFLMTMDTVKLKNIFQIEKVPDGYVIKVKAEVPHWFYYDDSIEATKSRWFEYYSDICMTDDEAKALSGKALEEYSEIGEGKYGGITIYAEETHEFHLVKSGGEYKIKNFVFKIDSYRVED